MHTDTQNPHSRPINTAKVVFESFNVVLRPKTSNLMDQIEVAQGGKRAVRVRGAERRELAATNLRAGAGPEMGESDKLELLAE